MTLKSPLTELEKPEPEDLSTKEAINGSNLISITVEKPDLSKGTQKSVTAKTAPLT